MIKYIIVSLSILLTFSCDKNNYIVNKSENQMIQYKSEVKSEVKPVEVKSEVTFWKPDCNPLWTFDDNCINQCYPLFNCY